MRAVWITRHGGNDVLEVRETEDPKPAAGEVRVRVERAGLNFAEVSARKGIYPDAPPPPFVAGYEAAGFVDELGPDTEGPAVGTRVMVLTRFGGHASLVCAPARQVIPIPDAMSFDEAASIPVVYLTAYHALFRVASLRPRERVLVHMAAGGVGTAVLQLCRTVEGVEVFGTASAGKHEHLRAQGCAHPIDYRTLDYEAEVRRLTRGEGVDIVLDPLGGREFRKGYRLLRAAGRLVMYGFASAQTAGGRNLLRVGLGVAQMPFFHPIQLMNDNRSVAGVNVGHLWGEVAMLREEIEQVLALYEKGQVKPVIDSVHSFDDAAGAFDRIDLGKNVGKVLLKP